VPPKPIRELRNLTRHRKAQIQERTREGQRLDKILQDAGVELSSVASDVLGRSGRAMLDALVAGSREIDRVIAPFARQVELLDTIPGIDRRCAEAIIAEVGVDMSWFGHSARLASWAGVCPGQHQSAGRRKTGKTRKGSKRLQTHLNEAATEAATKAATKAATRSKGTYLAAQYARLTPRRGHAKATVAVEHSILVSAFHILDRDVPYADLGADWFLRRNDPPRRTPRPPGPRTRLRRRPRGHHTRSLRSRLRLEAALTPREEARLVLSLQLASGMPRCSRITRRSASARPPHTPNGSRVCNANSRHWSMTGQRWQTSLACAVRRAREGLRSPSGWKNTPLSIPRQDPRRCHCQA
jgi:hypothetical protein